jgi:antitoxin component of MazEF toxin-antitoxin module
MIALGVAAMTTRIVRVGNTLTVEIPEELVTQASLLVGEPVEWVANGNGSISLVSSDSWEYKHIRAGLVELETGKGISNERVTEWLDRWGTEDESSAPQ